MAASGLNAALTRFFVMSGEHGAGMVDSKAICGTVPLLQSSQMAAPAVFLPAHEFAALQARGAEAAARFALAWRARL